MLKHKQIMMKQYFSKTILLLCLSILMSQNSFSGTSNNKNNKSFIVIIDPGHGGKDPGAMAKDIREKDVVLGVGLKLGKYLNENFPDVKVIYTRSTDVFIPLIDRSRIANKNKADLFISIHANFCGTPAIRGTETYFLGEARTKENLEVQKKEDSVVLLEDNYLTTYEGFDPNSSESNIIFSTIQNEYLSQSLSFAWDIQRQFQSRINSSNRGPKQAGFLVLRMSAMPSVLIETGFISNPAEANYLKSEEGQQNIAMSIISAFRKFKAIYSGANIPTTAETKSTPNSHRIADNLKAESINKNNANELERDTSPSEKAVKIEIVSVKPENASTKDTSKKDNDNKSSIEKTAYIAEKKIHKEINTPKEASTSNSSLDENSKYYSVQIGANTTPVEPTASNFKGIKDVRREKSDKYFRYYVGRESSIEQITPLLRKIQLKFSQAFIVSFADGKRIIINTETK